MVGKEREAGGAEQSVVEMPSQGAEMHGLVKEWKYFQKLPTVKFLNIPGPKIASKLSAE